MIIREFAQYVQGFNAEIPSLILLNKWLKEKLSRPAKTKVEKIIHNEIGLLKNKRGEFVLIGKNQSGRILLEALYNYTQSYDQHKFSKWIHKLKASDFKKS